MENNTTDVPETADLEDAILAALEFIDEEIDDHEVTNVTITDNTNKISPGTWQKIWTTILDYATCSPYQIVWGTCENTTSNKLENWDDTAVEDTLLIQQ